MAVDSAKTPRNFDFLRKVLYYIFFFLIPKIFPKFLELKVIHSWVKVKVYGLNYFFALIFYCFKEEEKIKIEEKKKTNLRHPTTHVIRHVSHVTCHMSHVTCHLSNTQTNIATYRQLPPALWFPKIWHMEWYLSSKKLW